ncbi:MarR family winged helix-turn-helix transcriptional regulator [Luteibacter yeojuensis]|nr:MarR family transcriptional regulator [Luteibacter yeojuensis]
MTPLDRLQMQLTTTAMASSRRFLRMLDVRLGDFEVTSATLIPMLLVGRSGGGINQVTLAGQIGVTGPSLVRTLDKLVELGLVRRECDPADRRAKTLWLTPAGEELALQLEARMVQMRREILAEVSEDDVRAALRVHQALNAAMGFELHDDT